MSKSNAHKHMLKNENIKRFTILKKYRKFEKHSQ